MTRKVLEPRDSSASFPEDLISIKKASQILGVHENTIRKLVREEELRAFLVGHRSIRISLGDLSQVVRPYSPGSLGMWRHLL